MAGKEKGKAGSFFSAVLGLVLVGVIGFIFTSGYRLIEDHNSFQKKADISLNEVIAKGETIQKGSFVEYEVRWVIGPYGNLTHTSSRNGIEAVSGVENYYYLILENGTVMTLISRNSAEVQKLNQMSEDLLKVEGYPTDGETFTVRGKITELTRTDMKKIFEEYLGKIFGLSKTSSNVSYLALDTTAGRSGLHLVIFGAIAVVILALVIRSKVRRKRAEEEAAGNDKAYEDPYHQS